MNTVCRFLIVLILIGVGYLLMNLVEEEGFRGGRRGGRRGRRGGRGRHRGGGRWWRNRRPWRNWWYWGPRWAYHPTVYYPYCNPFIQDCPAYLYNPYITY